MVDTGDLKSPPLIAGAGSTPVPSNFSIENKCNYVIANFVFMLFAFIGLGLNVCLWTLLDQELYYSVTERMKIGVVPLQILGVILLGVGRMGQLSLRRVNWHRVPKEEVLSDKISATFQLAGIVMTLYILCGIF